MGNVDEKGEDSAETAGTLLPLAAGQCYALDGGVFMATINAETQRLELWTHQGQSGCVIARTGFEVDDAGRLYDRIFDFEFEEQRVLADSRFTVRELQPVAAEERAAADRAAPPAGLKGEAGKLKRKPHAAIWT